MSNAWGDAPALDVDTDVENTPREVFEPVLASLRVDRFDTDPCTNPHAIVPAIVRYMLPADGLILPWVGNVWCNPPYSRPRPWVDRCAQHSSVMLLSGDYSTAMWRDVIWPTARLVVLMHGRIKHYNPARPTRGTAAKRPSALVYWAEPISTAAIAHLGKLVWHA